MDDVARLLAIEEIKTLKARYFRCVDTKAWDELALVFAPDVAFDRTTGSAVRDPWSGVWNPPLPDQPIIERGRQAVVAMVRRAVEPYHAVHHGHMPEIEILSETTASGLWAMEDVLRDKDHNLVIEGSGHYHETYEKLDGAWMIKTVKLTRMSLRIGARAERPERYL